MLIRMATTLDAAAIAAIYAPYVSDAAISFEYTPPTAQEIRLRMESILPQLPWLVCEEKEEILGYAYAAPNFTRAAYAWGTDLSIYLAPEACGRGVGRRLYESLLHILKEQGYFVAYGVITGENAASCRFHEALGFRLRAEFPKVGWKFGRWHSTLWYEKRLSDAEPAQMPKA